MSLATLLDWLGSGAVVVGLGLGLRLLAERVTRRTPRR